MTHTIHPRPGHEAAPSAATGSPRASIEELRRSLARMSGAERRLRSRDHSHTGELTHAQLRSIAALGREKEMTVGEIARSADLTPATVTGMIDQLEAANIVQRTRSTEDRRVCNVSLTSEGWRLLEQKLSTWQAIWEHELADVTEDEIETAVRVIRQVTAIYDSVTPPDDHQ
ncbi:MAG: MarR family transcriptional regulator, organic hydroperoxide resistance regulator [Solirubrobacteraceae bacterium]|jgi:DNA-binding MarR family transcriptional regulator|nr:MarR family transcriptional regulator, organic hydroperoxide resistance regulator [Solirubrobacteraceae bacterium]